jgi:hypothetical protein
VSLTDIVIPNSVKKIDQFAFSLCDGLKSIVIPSSVDTIVSAAFAGCGNLEKIDVAKDNPNYCSIDGVLFDKSKNTLVQFPQGRKGVYSIPEGVKEINDWAFSQCRNLTKVVIPNGVERIGVLAFSKCRGLTDIEFPESLTEIGGMAFNSCDGLTSVTIPNSVKAIGENAFYNCSRLTSVTFPQIELGVTDLYDIFDECNNLKSVNGSEIIYVKF